MCVCRARARARVCVGASVLHIVMLERFLRAYIMCSAFVKFPITFSIFIYIVCVMLVTSALLAAEQALYKMIPIIVIVDTTDRSH